MFQNTSSSSQSSSTGNPNRQKFVEGTVSQLARVLYSLHREYGAQPSNAIFEAITTFGDDVERNTILQSARCSAEALARKQKALQSNAKFKSSMTVFEQAQQLKEALIDKLKEEMEDAWKASECKGQDHTVTESFLETYDQIKDYRISLIEDIVHARYSQPEIDQAKERLQRVKQIESHGSNDSEDTIPLMKQIWLQLVKDFYCRKISKTLAIPRLLSR